MTADKLQNGIPNEETDRPMTQQTQVMLKIRQMVLDGVLAPGERLAEAALAERLGLSRTPVRQALPALAQEGLLALAGKRGYVVRSFTSSESIDAIEARAALEGLAAQAIAAGGPSAELLAALRACLAEGDAVLAVRPLTAEAESRYGQMNSRFHALLVEGAGKSLYAELVDRCNRVPLAAPASVAFERMPPDRLYDLLFYAHQQHHAIVEAITQGQGMRADFLLREHAHQQERTIR